MEKAIMIGQLGRLISSEATFYKNELDKFAISLPTTNHNPRDLRISSLGGEIKW
jgi:hypothetical protein